MPTPSPTSRIGTGSAGTASRPYTTEHELDHYSHARFARRTTRISFYASIVNRVVFRLANRWPERYERRWAWVFPAWFLYYELEVRK